MRKILLSTILFGLLLSVTFGQSISLSNSEGIDIPANSVITELVDAGAGTYAMHLEVTNTSDSPVGVLVKKVENYLEGETMVSFCWAGQCFGPNVFLSPHADTLQPGETNFNDFIGDLFPSGAGISSVTYVFFDENNGDDSVSVVVNFSVTSTPTSFALSNDDGDLENNGTLTVSGLADDVSLTSYVDVKNISNQEIEVKVRRIETHLLLETSSYFTWVDTYPSTTDVSPVGVILNFNESSPFSGDYEPNGMAGDATISYVFFDANDSSNYSTINVKYTAAPLGIEDNSMNSIVLSNAYPNPAKSVVSLDYDLKGFNNAKLVVYNLLGSAVKDVQINESMGKLDINVNDLDDGIYFYSLLVNNEIVKTQKLMIQH